MQMAAQIRYGQASGHQDEARRTSAESKGQRKETWKALGFPSAVGKRQREAVPLLDRSAALRLGLRPAAETIGKLNHADLRRASSFRTYSTKTGYKRRDGIGPLAPSRKFPAAVGNGRRKPASGRHNALLRLHHPSACWSRWTRGSFPLPYKCCPAGSARPGAGS